MNQPLSIDQVFLNRLNEIIKDNLQNEKFGVDDLSHDMCMSYSKIHRKLKSLVNKPVRQYIREVRLQQAMEMLLNNVASVSEIAYRVGFRDPAYFNNCFHEYYGYPPGEVKKLEECDREKARHMITPEPTADRIEPLKTKKERTNRKKLVLRVVFSALFVILVLFPLFYFFNDTLFQRSREANHNTITDTEISIAILPFKNIGNDPEQDWFSEGMTEEILNHLFKIGGFKIPSSLSTMQFKETKLSIREIARKLGVSYVLEGNVSMSENQVRVMVSLVNGKNEEVVWTEDYKRAMTAANILDIQSDVALRVVENLKVIVHPEVKERIKARCTENTEAYILYLQSNYESYQQSMEMLKRAVSLDPGFADAYANMAYTIMWYAGDSLNREQKIEKVEPLLNKALQLDRNSVVAHANVAEFKLWFYWDLETVEKEYQIFKQLNPSNYEAFSSFSQYLWAVGRSREAYKLCEANFKQNKNSHYDWVHMALAYEGIGKKEKALETIETALHLFRHADFVLPRNALRLFVTYGRYEEAIGLFEKYTAGKDISELSDGVLGDAGIAYYASGNKGKANTFLNELLSTTRDIGFNNTCGYAAALYVAMGENDKALQWLEKAYIRREPRMVGLKYDPHFRPLHGDPQFEELLLKIRSE